MFLVEETVFVKVEGQHLVSGELQIVSYYLISKRVMHDVRNNTGILAVPNLQKTCTKLRDLAVILEKKGNHYTT